MTRPHRVLLVDDDPLARSGLRLLLRSAGDIEVVAEAADGDEVVPAVQAHHPDVILMDLGMARMNGIEATAQVRALPNPPHVVALTTWDVSDAVMRCIDAGAAGYLLKSDGPDVIVKAVRDVVAGDAVLSPRSTRQLLERFRNQPGDAERVRARELVATLSERELEVARRVGRGLSNATVAGQLYVSEATVKTHLSAVQAKLGARNRVEVAVVAERAGLLAQ
ncbi:response regulator transcription factor [Ruania suaedae]|uniref:response regulator n=1 Tax=Ruania suaedae TaxID=2897774 RepID=UPI001E459C7E|nr:response regulator transcription factor [Ruania suaedae]UFU03771.1 response regulator transcription factor [Ruania suaedae]